MVLKQSTELKFDFQIVNHMLLHEIKTSKKREMWFKISGCLTRFSKSEFYVVTGLPCQRYTLGLPTSVSLEDFFGQCKVTYDEILDMFVKEPVDSPKKLIMARLILVEQVINFRRNKVVSDLNLSLCCDPERFDRYDWGSPSYSSLLASLKKCASKSFYVTDLEERTAYDMQGYALAFHKWIFEVVPKISDSIECSFYIRLNDSFSLHWKNKVSKLYEECKDMFKMDMEVVFPTYGQFAYGPEMEPEEEVPDQHVDYLCSVPDALVDNIEADTSSQPPLSQNPKGINDLYNVRKSRVWYHKQRHDILCNRVHYDPPYLVEKAKMTKLTKRKKYTKAEIKEKALKKPAIELGDKSIVGWELDLYEDQPLINMMKKSDVVCAASDDDEDQPIGLRKRKFSRTCKGEAVNKDVVKPVKKKKDRVVTFVVKKKMKAGIETETDKKVADGVGNSEIVPIDNVEAKQGKSDPACLRNLLIRIEELESEMKVLRRTKDEEIFELKERVSQLEAAVLQGKAEDNKKNISFLLFP